jgi:protein gp37
VTSISWCDYSWNPITGCSYAGPECTNCYAERLSLEHGRSDSQWLPQHAEENLAVHPARLDEPDEFDYPDGFGRVFVCSMSDLFHPLVAEEVIESVVQTAWDHPEHIWLFLTKRPERAADLSLNWPANAWVGTSVGSGPGGEYADTTHRINALRDVDAETRWVSFEPLIEPVGGLIGPYPDLSGIDWVVVGGESEPDDDVRRDMNEDWAHAIYQAAREQDVPFYFKQQSGRQPESDIRLTVKNEQFDVWGEEVIRQTVAPPERTARARAQLQE